MGFFVWTKMQTESGLSLPTILALKEVERLAGNGVFWWGVGNSLGETARQKAVEAGGTLPVLFSMMLSRPQRIDTHPEKLHLWAKWEDLDGKRRDLPAHVMEWSRAGTLDSHYALVCHSHTPLAIGSHGAFDPNLCKTVNGKLPAGSQSTALLEGTPYEDHSLGGYHFGFRATLIKPWFVKLVAPRELASTDRHLFEHWKQDWVQFVDRLRRGQDRERA